MVVQENTETPTVGQCFTEIRTSRKGTAMMAGAGRLGPYMYKKGLAKYFSNWILLVMCNPVTDT